LQRLLLHVYDAQRQSSAGGQKWREATLLDGPLERLVGRIYERMDAP
jgi:hypothetical protein